MAVPFKYNSILHGVPAVKQAAVKPEPRSVNNQNNFCVHLQNYLQETAICSAAGGPIPELSGARINLLVQIQMSQSLLNALFPNEKENDLPFAVMDAIHTGQTAAVLPESSKNRRIPPKNDANLGEVNIEACIEKAALKYAVDPDLIRAVIKVESNYDSTAASDRGAIGLMQLMPETAKELGIKNARDPEENIMGGTRYLKSLLDRYNGEIETALAAYNWGIGNLEKSSRQLPRETLNYIARVAGRYRQLKSSA